MLKTLLGFAILLLTSYLGKKMTEKYSLRFKFISALDDFNSAMIRDISFKREGVIALMANDYGNEDFEKYLKGVVNAKKIDTALPELPPYIQADDAIKISDYFSSIGSLNSNSEVDLLNSMREQLSKKKSEYGETSSKYKNLGLKLGFALGAALFIIII